MSFAPLSVEDVLGLNVNYYFNIIAYTLLVYDYALTFNDEVERFWKPSSRPTWAVTFFFFNRYFTLFGHIAIIFQYFWVSVSPEKPLICRRLQSFHQYFAVTVQIWVATLLIMRMYALYDRSRRILALYLGVAITAVGIACWAILTGKSDEDKLEYSIPMGCPTGLSAQFAQRLGAAWGGMLVFDTLVFALTVYKSYTLRHIHGVGLVALLLRDGSVYFFVMMATNLINIFTFLYGTIFTRGVATTFMNIISSIMISRLMLNLRNPRLLKSSVPPTTATIRNRDIVSTFVDPRIETEFTDAGFWSQPNYFSRHSTEDLYTESMQRRHHVDDGAIELTGRSRSDP